MNTSVKIEKTVLELSVPAAGKSKEEFRKEIIVDENVNIHISVNTTNEDEFTVALANLKPRNVIRIPGKAPISITGNKSGLFAHFAV